MKRRCGDCGAMPGKLHIPGCDIEQCPRCGWQAISCHCIYEVNKIDVDDIKDHHSEVYKNGPTPEMYAKFDAQWGSRRIPWTGESWGTAECREFGWYSMWVEDKGWRQCGKDAPGAGEDLNRLAGGEALWNAETQRYDLKKQPRISVIRK